jgi:hypothetical protein
MCRKDLSIKATSKSKSPPNAPVRLPPSIPYSPQRILVPEETGQQITYHEFLDRVTQSNSYQHTRIEVRHPIRIQQPQQPQQVVQKPISISQKLLKIALCLGILVAIAVVFIIII